MMKSNVTIYTNPLTNNGIKISLTCKAIGFTPDIIPLALHKGEQRNSEFLKLNPDGKIPVLVNDDFVLSESNAILHYLAKLTNSTLWPNSIKAQSLTLKWLLWQANTWSPATASFAHRKIVMPHWGIHKNESIEYDYLTEFHGLMNQFDQQMKGKNFIVSTKPTIADIALASSLIFHREADIPIQDYRNLLRWLDLLEDQYWWQKTYQELIDLIY